MIYLKTFEELSFKPDYEPHWSKNVDSQGNIHYTFELSDKVFNVYFDKQNYQRLGIDVDNIYEREYRSEEGFKLVDIGATKVISVITAITFDFIKDYKPNCIIINHINVSGENVDYTKLNKRANLNYQFLKNIQDYKLSYYGMKLSSTTNRSMTLCMISKPNFDCDALVKAWDRNLDYQRHVPIVLE